MPRLIAYDTSASAFGDKNAVVGYGGYAFFPIGLYLNPWN